MAGVTMTGLSAVSSQASIAGQVIAPIRIRVIGVGDRTGTVCPITVSGTAVSWPTPPTGIPAVTSPQLFPVTVDPGTVQQEVIYITSYVPGATSGTCLRNREGTTLVTHTSRPWVHGQTIFDFPTAGNNDGDSLSWNAALGMWVNTGPRIVGRFMQATVPPAGSNPGKEVWVDDWFGGNRWYDMPGGNMYLKTPPPQQYFLAGGPLGSSNTSVSSTVATPTGANIFNIIPGSGIVAVMGYDGANKKVDLQLSAAGSSPYLMTPCFFTPSSGPTASSNTHTVPQAYPLSTTAGPPTSAHPYTSDGGIYFVPNTANAMVRVTCYLSSVTGTSTGASLQLGLATASAGTVYGTFNTTIASGSNGASLPQSTINVVSTNGAPSNGTNTIQVTTGAGVQTVTYTGVTATSFTGCSGGTGTMSTGGAVSGGSPLKVFGTSGVAGVQTQWVRSAVTFLCTGLTPGVAFICYLEALSSSNTNITAYTFSGDFVSVEVFPAP